jgi:hypothetical protein
MAANRYKVQAKVWAKWSKAARAVFNEVYRSMRSSQWAYLHPQDEPKKRSFWRTTAWNAAWVAACAVDGVTVDVGPEPRTAPARRR